jgi:2-polyprenyl-3-methyl-5-hydroxy-6-metoxy-1,4-benzoquinol methylase
MTGYALENSWDRAKRRLARLEEYLDPFTQRRMTKLGIRDGLRCLEVGGGGGSVANWLCEQVGPTGRVVATDINIQFLQDIKHSNLTSIPHDIAVDSLPQSEFDFVHTRWLLHHLPEPERAISRMIGALRPGGWLLLEEVFPGSYLLLAGVQRLHGGFNQHCRKILGTRLFLGASASRIGGGNGSPPGRRRG